MTRPHVPELGLPPGLERERLTALRALRNCGVIRVTLGNVPLGIRLLFKEGAVRGTKTTIEDKADCRLTDAGLALAAKLKGPGQ